MQGCVQFKLPNVCAHKALNLTNSLDELNLV